jgi:hypothetical protein
MTRARQIGIREAVEYLAMNGEEELGDEEMSYVVPVMMVAHLFEREPKDVAAMVMRCRERFGI